VAEEMTDKTNRSAGSLPLTPGCW